MLPEGAVFIVASCAHTHKHARPKLEDTLLWLVAQQSLDQMQPSLSLLINSHGGNPLVVGFPLCLHLLQCTQTNGETVFFKCGVCVEGFISAGGTDTKDQCRPNKGV